jgi:hypothetical protein
MAAVEAPSASALAPAPAPAAPPADPLWTGVRAWPFVAPAHTRVCACASPMCLSASGAELSAHVAMVDKGAAAGEARYLVRVLRTFNAQRRTLTKALLARALREYHGAGTRARTHTCLGPFLTLCGTTTDAARRDELLAALGEVRALLVPAHSVCSPWVVCVFACVQMATDAAPTVPPARTSAEARLYLALLVVAYLHDQAHYTEVRTPAQLCRCTQAR